MASGVLGHHLNQCLITHYNDVIMTTMASQITSPHGCLLNRLFRHRSKKTSKLRITGLCVGNSPGPVNSPHKGLVTRKMFPFDDIIMICEVLWHSPKGIFTGNNQDIYPWYKFEIFMTKCARARAQLACRWWKQSDLILILACCVLFSGEAVLLPPITYQAFPLIKILGLICLDNEKSA